MRKISYLTFLLCLSALVNAQTIERSVISFTGSSVQHEGVHLSYTAGEPVVGTVSNEDNHLTQGFQQPSEVPVINEGSGVHMNVTVFPNPVTNQLNVVIGQGETQDLYVGIYDVLGKRLGQKRVSHLEMAQTNVTLAFDEMSQGMYFVSVSDTDGEIIQTFKVTKVK